MKKTLPLVLALTIPGVCCVVAVFFCQFYYPRYRNAVTELEYRINALDTRLATLEGHKSRELIPVHVWGIISTADRPEDQHMHFYLSSEKHAGGYFEAINAKGGPLIRPEFRLPTGVTTNCEYDIQIESQFGNVVDAWLSHAEPYQDLGRFDEFRVRTSGRTNVVRLIARPQQNASVQMRFDLVLLCER